jgi:phosphoesterase RecJ-like protein
MRLLGYCLHEKMEILNDFATGIISLSKKEMRSFSFKTGDSEGFVNYPLSVKGVRFSAFFVEKEDHIRISFRSKGNFAVNEFAQKYFNGGGHANASGGESFVSLNETVQRFKDLLPLYKSTLQNHED